MNPISLQLAPPLATESTRHRLLRAALLTLAVAGGQAARGQAIYSVTEHAEPGGVISVRGDGMDENAQFTLYPYSIDGKRLPGVVGTLTRANGQIALVRLPTNLKSTMYEVVASTASGTTNSVFVNRPRVGWADTAEAMPDGVVRIVGRNFKPFASSTPFVSLSNGSTRSTLRLSILSASDSMIFAQVPSNLAIGTYQMIVNNGLSGGASAASETLPLTIKNKSADPFDLGVSWGADFVPMWMDPYNVKTDPRLAVHAKGDGVSDDTAAFTSNIWNFSRAGGGMLYLPAGTYRLSGPIVVPPNVVLKGDGRGRTILQVGERYNPMTMPTEDDWAITLWGEGTGHCGLANMTVQNLNANTLPNGVLRTGPGYAMSSYVFLKDVDFQLGNGRQLWISQVRKGAFVDCAVTGKSLTQGAIAFGDVQDTLIARNTFDYRAARTYLLLGKRVVFERNKILMDNSFHTNAAIETGGLETSLSQQLLVSDNDVAGYNGPVTKNRGDAEMIMTQMSNVPDFRFVGMVHAVNGKVLVPSSPWPTTSWYSPFHTQLPRIAVMILSGKGAGQWRMATGWSSNSVTVDRPWQIDPDMTSRFSISPMSCYGQTIVNNRMSGGYIGVELYNGAVDSVIADNTLTNTGQIVVRGDCQEGNVSGANFGFLPVWDVSIVKNSVSETDMITPACISAAAIDVESAAFGMLISGVDIRYNTINGNWRSKLVSEIGADEGLEVLNWYYDGRVTDAVNNVGTILESNVISKAFSPINIRGGVSFGEFANRLLSGG